MSEAKVNTDRELWRESDDWHANSIHVTEQGSIGIDVGGSVYVRPLKEWHKAVKDFDTLKAELTTVKQLHADALELVKDEHEHGYRRGFGDGLEAASNVIKDRILRWTINSNVSNALIDLDIDIRALPVESKEPNAD
jgi:hypothetical protein